MTVYTQQFSSDDGMGDPDEGMRFNWRIGEDVGIDISEMKLTSITIEFSDSDTRPPSPMVDLLVNIGGIGFPHGEGRMAVVGGTCMLAGRWVGISRTRSVHTSSVRFLKDPDTRRIKSWNLTFQYRLRQKEQERPTRKSETVWEKLENAILVGAFIVVGYAIGRGVGLL